MVVTLPKFVTIPDALLTRKDFCELAVKGNAKRIEEVGTGARVGSGKGQGRVRDGLKSG